MRTIAIQVRSVWLPGASANQGAAARQTRGHKLRARV